MTSASARRYWGVDSQRGDECIKLLILSGANPCELDALVMWLSDSAVREMVTSAREIWEYQGTILAEQCDKFRKIGPATSISDADKITAVVQASNDLDLSKKSIMRRIRYCLSAPPEEGVYTALAHVFAVPMTPYKDLANLAAVSTKFYSQVRGHEVEGKGVVHTKRCLPKLRRSAVEKVAPLDPAVIDRGEAVSESALAPLPMELISQFLGCRGSLDETRSVLDLLSENRKGVVVDDRTDSGVHTVSGGGGGGSGRGR